MSPRKPQAAEVPTEAEVDHKGKETGKRRPVTTDIKYPTSGGQHERIGPTEDHIVSREPEPEQPAAPAEG